MRITVCAIPVNPLNNSKAQSEVRTLNNVVSF